LLGSFCSYCLWFVVIVVVIVAVVVVPCPTVRWRKRNARVAVVQGRSCDVGFRCTLSCCLCLFFRAWAAARGYFDYSLYDDCIYDESFRARRLVEAGLGGDDDVRSSQRVRSCQPSMTQPVVVQ
jgi:hypothetical protein